LTLQQQHTVIGASAKRKEDPRLLSGRWVFVDDIKFPEMVYAAVLRSPYSHARIRRIDVDRCLKLDGVVGVLTGEEVVRISKPFVPWRGNKRDVLRYCLATDKVRCVGDEVAVVAANDRATAEDALELIQVEYEPLKPIVEIVDALKPDAPIIYEEIGSNIIWNDNYSFGDVEGAFKRADLVVKETFRFHRYTSVPLETAGCIAHYERLAGNLTIYTNDQFPGFFFETICNCLGLSGDKLRIVVPDVGGGFGQKVYLPSYFFTSLLSIKIGRPVKWIETRRENLAGPVQSADGIFEIELALKNDGTVDGVRIKDYENEGAGLHYVTVHAMLKLSNIVNGYRVKNVTFEPYSVASNKCPSGANRGIGKPGMVFMFERMLDIGARKLGLSPVEIRLRNFIRPEEFPYVTPSGNVYDSGNYHDSLKTALEEIGYEKLRQEQRNRPVSDKRLGIGIAFGVEPSTVNSAYRWLSARKRMLLDLNKLPMTGSHGGATIKVDPTGKVLVKVGAPSCGQGHETSAAQVVAQELGLPYEDIEVSPMFDTASHPWAGYSGILSNKFSDVDLGAVLGASRRLKEKILAVAAHRLKTDVASLSISGGKMYVGGSLDTGVDLREIARIAYYNVLLLPPGMEPGLEATCMYSNPWANMPDEQGRVRMFNNFPYETHVAVVEVDCKTGKIEILRYLVVSDCGNMINPMIVDGQIHGAALHGISASIYEEFVYDSEGQLLSSTFMDYLKPTTMEAPEIEVHHLVNPSPFTPLGTKGVGEGAAIPAPAAIANAVEDALSDLGVKITELPLSPERVLRLIVESGKTRTGTTSSYEDRFPQSLLSQEIHKGAR
jgi:2-furoyl-CoA dehydrogenase large subunit